MSDMKTETFNGEQKLFQTVGSPKDKEEEKRCPKISRLS